MGASLSTLSKSAPAAAGKSSLSFAPNPGVGIGKRGRLAPKKTVLRAQVPLPPPSEEVHRMFEELLKDRDLPPGVIQQQVRIQTVQSQWFQIFSAEQQKAVPEVIHQELLDSWTPGDYVEELLRLQQEGDLKALVRLLKTVRENLTQYSSQWRLELMDQRVLEVLITFLPDTSGSFCHPAPRGSCEVFRAVLRTIMMFASYKEGLERILLAPGAALKVLLCFTVRMEELKINALQLAGVLCFASNEGLNMILNALEEFKITCGEPCRFFSLVDTLRARTSSASFRASLLTFMNIIVNTPLAVEERVAMRGELLSLGLAQFLSQHNRIAETRHLLPELASQIDVFQQAMDRDKYAVIIEKIDVSDMEQLFEALYNRTIRTEGFPHLLSILKQMLLIPSERLEGKRIWAILDRHTQEVTSFPLTGQPLPPNFSLSFSRLGELVEVRNQIERSLPSFKAELSALSSTPVSATPTSPLRITAATQEIHPSASISPSLASDRLSSPPSRAIANVPPASEVRQAEATTAPFLSDVGSSVPAASLPTSVEATGNQMKQQQSNLESLLSAARPPPTPTSSIALSSLRTISDSPAGLSQEHIADERKASLSALLASRLPLPPAPPLSQQSGTSSISAEAPTAPVSTSPLFTDAKYAVYLKMLKLRLPRGAVEQKMSMDGHDPALLDAYFTANQTSEVSGEGERRLKAEVSIPQPAPSECPAGPPPTPAAMECNQEGLSQTRAKLSALIAARRPLPPPPPPEDIGPSIADNKSSTLLASSTTATTDERCAKYLRMLKMGVPRAAVQQKMSAEGCDPALLDQHSHDPIAKEDKPLTYATISGNCPVSSPEPLVAPVPSTSSSPLFTEERYAKYLRMLKMGLPRGAAEQKMRMDGLDPSILEDYFKVSPATTSAESAARKESTTSPPVPAPGPAPSLPPGAVPAKEHEKFKKYFKLLSMGMPLAQVQLKMKSEGIPTEVLDASDPYVTAGGELISCATGGSTAQAMPVPEPRGRLAGLRPRSLSVDSGCAPLAETPRALSRRRLLPTPRVPLKNLHWDAIGADAIKGTIWDEIAQSEEEEALKSSASAEDGKSLLVDGVKVNLEALEAIFAKQEAKKEKEIAKTAAPSKVKGRVSIVDPARSKNLAISMIIFNKLPPAVIRQSLMDLDVSMLSVERLQVLLKALEIPTAKEAQQIRDFSGDPKELDDPEGLLLELQRIPRLPARIKFLITSLQFGNQLQSLATSVSTVRAACREVVSSTDLKKILKLILQIGNFMNSNRGEAYGFKLSNLGKLMEVKGNAGNTSLLHLLARSIKDTNPGLINFLDGMRSVPETLNQSLDGVLKASILKLEGDVKLVRLTLDQELARKARGEALDESFTSSMSSFLKTAEVQTQALREDYQRACEEFDFLAKKFGENPETDPQATMETLFRYLLNFSRSLQNCERENQKRDEEEARRKRIEERKASMKRTVEGDGSKGKGQGIKGLRRLREMKDQDASSACSSPSATSSSQDGISETSSVSSGSEGAMRGTEDQDSVSTASASADMISLSRTTSDQSIHLPEFTALRNSTTAEILQAYEQRRDSELRRLDCALATEGQVIILGKEERNSTSAATPSSLSPRRRQGKSLGAPPLLSAEIVGQNVQEHATQREENNHPKQQEEDTSVIIPTTSPLKRLLTVKPISLGIIRSSLDALRSPKSKANDEATRTTATKEEDRQLSNNQEEGQKEWSRKRSSTQKLLEKLFAGRRDLIDEENSQTPSSLSVGGQPEEQR